jgi:hypothetical protein
MGMIGWMRAAAERAYKEFENLTLAKAQMRSCIAHRRRSSRLGKLIELFIARPLVSIPLASKELGITASRPVHAARDHRPQALSLFDRIINRQHAVGLYCRRDGNTG